MKNIYKIIILLLLSVFPLNVFAENINIDIVSTKALLVNLNDNKILYEKNINTKTKIASLNEIVTI